MLCVGVRVCVTVSVTVRDQLVLGLEIGLPFMVSMGLG